MAGKRAHMTNQGLAGGSGRLVWVEAEQRLRCTADAKKFLKEGAEPGSDEARCGNTIPPGFVTCRFHGGAAPQSRQAARLRVADLLLPALQRVGQIIARSGNLDDPDERKTYLDAARLLARYGLGEQVSVDVTTDVLLDRIDQMEREFREQEDL